MDLMHLPVHERGILDGKRKAEMVKTRYKKVRMQIEEKRKLIASKVNKGRRRVTFEPRDWVWVHFRKEHFPEQRKSKLEPRGDGPFQVIKRINDNAYKVDLPSEYNVSTTFNVSDLSLFDVGSDSRTNPFQEGGDDMIQESSSTKVSARRDPLVVDGGPMT